MSVGADGSVKIGVKAVDNASSTFAAIAGKVRAFAGEVTSLGDTAKIAAGVFISDLARDALQALSTSLSAAGEQFKDLEWTLTGVVSASGETAEAAEHLYGELSEVAHAQTRLGYTSVEAAQALESLVKAGLSGVDASKALEASLQMARIESIDTATASGLLVGVMNQFSYAAEDAAIVVDTLVNASVAGIDTASDFGTALSYCGSQASNMNFSLEETSAALVAINNQGIAAEKAGRYLASMFGDLVKKSDKLGFSIYDAHGEMLDLSQIVGKLVSKLKSFASQAERDAYLTEVFGKQSIRAALALMNVGDETTSAEEALKELEETMAKTGTATDTTSKLMDTTKGRLMELDAQIANASERLGVMASQVQLAWKQFAVALGPIGAVADALGPSVLQGAMAALGMIMAQLITKYGVLTGVKLASVAATIKEKVVSLATAAAKVILKIATWALNAALATQVALITLGVGLAIAAAAAITFMAKMTADAAKTEEKFSGQVEDVNETLEENAEIINEVTQGYGMFKSQLSRASSKLSSMKEELEAANKSLAENEEKLRTGQTTTVEYVRIQGARRTGTKRLTKVVTDHTDTIKQSIDVQKEEIEVLKKNILEQREKEKALEHLADVEEIYFSSMTQQSTAYKDALERSGETVYNVLHDATKTYEEKIGETTAIIEDFGKISGMTWEDSTQAIEQAVEDHKKLLKEEYEAHRKAAEEQRQIYEKHLAWVQTDYFDRYVRGSEEFAAEVEYYGQMYMNALQMSSEAAVEVIDLYEKRSGRLWEDCAEDIHAYVDGVEDDLAEAEQVYQNHLDMINAHLHEHLLTSQLSYENVGQFAEAYVEALGVSTEQAERIVAFAAHMWSDHAAGLEVTWEEALQAITDYLDAEEQELDEHNTELAAALAEELQILNEHIDRVKEFYFDKYVSETEKFARAVQDEAERITSIYEDFAGDTEALSLEIEAIIAAFAQAWGITWDEAASILFDAVDKMIEKAEEVEQIPKTFEEELLGKAQADFQAFTACISGKARTLDTDVTGEMENLASNITGLIKAGLVGEAQDQMEAYVNCSTGKIWDMVTQIDEYMAELTEDHNAKIAEMREYAETLTGEQRDAVLGLIDQMTSEYMEKMQNLADWQAALLESMSEETVGAIDEMASETADALDEMADQIEESNEDISASVEEMTEEVQNNIEKMADEIVVESIWPDMLDVMIKQTRSAMKTVSTLFQDGLAGVSETLEKTNIPDLDATVSAVGKVGVSSGNVSMPGRVEVTVSGPLVYVEGSVDETTAELAAEIVKKKLESVIVENTSAEADTKKIRVPAVV